MSQGKLTLTFAALASLLALAMADAHAAVPAGETWRGVVSGGSAMVRASLERIGDRVALRFGEPRNCRIDAELLQEDAAGARFRFQPVANGGHFCDQLYPGELRVAITASGASVAFTHHGHAWSGELPLAGKP
ncbi:hypothetical protein FIV34_02530 [Luteibacter pinisoli]|uniref:Uncharacterized protein n=1 Tax=Luteibacter pinisoli TaxID=2589080 RepID=A0A4Y5YZB0_9GAMM|nr:hypothetical protein [Luteibacter pinisoli]QDE38154.1 hypothetical protein FIV34_02530 [Luteibacter pinisoli]